jgi:hypothetical protein
MKERDEEYNTSRTYQRVLAVRLRTLVLDASESMGVQSLNQLVVALPGMDGWKEVTKSADT